MKKFLLIGLFLTCQFFAYSQTYLMSNGNISTCSGMFYDDGGANGKYFIDTTLTYTVCSSNPGFQMEVFFSVFDTENNFDDLCIYDGNLSTSPLIGCFDGKDLQGETIKASGSCLTFVFDSDFIINDTGWVAEFSCKPPCQQVDASTISVTPTPTGPDNEINICLGDQISASGSATFPQNNTYYAQSEATSTFTWYTGGGGITTGQSVTIDYLNPRRSGLYLVVSDVEGCTDTLKVGTVSAGLPPTFSDVTFFPNDTICFDDSTVISIFAQPTPVTIPALEIGDTTLLPDGSGQSYTSSITIDIFDPTATVQDGYIQSIFAEMEHSYLGDLEIEIICPNGQSAILKQYPGGGSTHLGEPIDMGNSLDPGKGYLYQFQQNNPTYGTMTSVAGDFQHSYTDLNGNNYTNEDYLPAGSYTPFENYDNQLAGCPLNGDWTLNVTDNLNIDDGFIFQWGINFNPIILSDTTGQEILPQVISKVWSPDPSIVANPDDSTIVVSPTAPGDYSYTFTIQDDFGCTHDTIITIHVKNRPQSIAGPDSLTCLQDILLTPTPQGINPQWTSYTTETGTVNFPDATIFNAHPTVSDYGTYQYILTEEVDGCQTYPDTVTVVHFQLLNTIDISVDDDSVCIPQEITFTNNSDMTQFTDLQWDFGDGEVLQTISNPTHVYATEQCYDVTFTLYSAEGCFVDSVFPNFVCAYNYPTANFIFNPFEPVVPETTISFTNLSIGNNLFYAWDFDGLGVDSIADPEFQFPNNLSGTYENTLIAYNVAGCADTIMKPVTIKDFLSIFIPNSFTPNNDNANDFWKPVLTNSDLAKYKVIVFDRWGNIVAESEELELDFEWNGKTKDGSIAAEGVYTYLIRWKELEEVKDKKKTGHIILFR